jgi:hypothetical protein
MEMAYVAGDAHLAHRAAKTHAIPVGPYALLGGTMVVLVSIGGCFWLLESVVPGAIQGMVMVFGAA